MAYAPGAVERAMKVQEVIVQAVAGTLTWIQAAEILGCSARTIRRYRWRLERHGYDGLFDRRRRLPSPKRAPLAELQRVLTLYRGRLIRHARYFTLQLAESYLTGSLFRQILQRIEQLALPPT